MKPFFIALLTVVFLLLSACSSTFNSATRNNKLDIKQQMEIVRAHRLSELQYELHFTLTDENQFSVMTNISFELSDSDKALTLDLDQANITHLEVNEQNVYPNYNGNKIILSPHLLHNGHNTVEVHFSRQYSINGKGLNRFVDPTDAKIYLYSDTNAANAQQMFAVFDQPALKANFTLTVTAPPKWTVISTMQPDTITEYKEARRWQFPPTAKLSPDSFVLHAGPYQQWSDDSGPYLLRLFARQSIKDKVNPKEWFTYTQQGINFFDDYFSVAYPFNKYDQLLAPNALNVTQSNAATVTFSESILQSQVSTKKQRLASSIMHELAHQWFGHLVTMKWRRAAWLHESLASLMGNLATAKTNGFEPLSHNLHDDNTQHTSPLVSHLTPDLTDASFSHTANNANNFSAISSAKATAILNQMRHFLSEQIFQQGIRHYLKKFSYQNTQFSEFTNSMESVADRDLTTWSQQWFSEAKPNSIHAEFSCADGRITEFTLHQSPAHDLPPTLRKQRVQVGLFTQGSQRIYHNISVPVTYQGDSTPLPRLIGLHCPDLVYPNEQGWGFVNVNLDPVSFNTAKKYLRLVADPLLRAMLWQSLWEAVEAGHLSLNDYIGAVLINLPDETEDTIVAQVLNKLVKMQVYLDRVQPNHQHFAEQVIRAIEQMSLRKVMANHSNNALQQHWFEHYITFARSQHALHHLDSLLNRTATIKGLTLDQNLRWKIITHLSRYDHPSAMYWLRKERDADKSDSGRLFALAAEVVQPSAPQKRHWLAKIQQQSQLSFSQLRTVMAHLYPSEQQVLGAVTATSRLHALTTLDKTKDAMFMHTYAKYLIPTECSYTNVSVLESLQKNKVFSTPTTLALAQAIEQEQLCLLITSKIDD